MNNTKKPLSIVFIIFIVIVFVALVSLIYSYFSVKSPAVTQQSINSSPVGTATSTNAVVDSTININIPWLTYTSTENGFSVNYPSTWKNQQKDNAVGFEPKNTSDDEINNERYVGDWTVIVSDSNSSSLNALLDDFGFDPGVKKYKTIAINGHTATLITSKNSDTGETLQAVDIKDNKKEFVILDEGGRLVDGDGNPNFQKFYNSFKLLK